MISFLLIFLMSLAQAQMCTPAKTKDLCDNKGTLQTLAQQTCEISWKKNKCDEFAKNHPETITNKTLRDCKNEGSCPLPLKVGRELTSCMKGWGEAWKDLAVGVYEFLSGESSSLTEDDLKRRDFFENCKTPECKRKMLGPFASYFSKEEIEGQNGDLNQYDQTDPAQRNLLFGHSASTLYRKLLYKLKEEGLQNKNFDQKFIQPWSEKEAPLPLSFNELIEKMLEQSGLKNYQCLKPETVSQLRCYALFTLLDPTLVVGAPAIFRKIAGLSLKLATRAEKLAKLESSWEKTLTKAESEAIDRAHRIGLGEVGKDGTSAKVGNYTQGQLLRKYRELRKSFTPQQIRELMEKGIVGAPASEGRNLDRLIYLELKTSELKDLSLDMPKEVLKDPEYHSFQTDLANFEKERENLLANWDPDDANSNALVSKKLKFLENKAESFKEKLKIWKERARTRDWGTVRTDPQILMPNRTYKIATDRGEEIKVRFSPKVTKEIMWNVEDDLRAKAAKEFVEALGRGKRAHRGTSGFDILTVGDRQKIVKIHIIGKAVGAYRVYGVEHNGVFHFVEWAQESNHGANYLQRVHEKTLSSFEREVNP
ncbi:MAG: hypothetical protein CL676_06055 [Bdellovibrionaceae bacterium]|nr:hypothetical protein [Pseudobdellovibrionaceae bacterium]|tara:strand:+ start:3121 stop:4905 length:1785 start_codon:yes stop_codon:yes gene_type:complete